MNRSDADVLKEMIEHAREEGFPHVESVLARMIRDDSVDLSPQDREQLRIFGRFIEYRARLRFPYWSDDDAPFIEAHETEYLELVNGAWGKFAAFLYDELKIALREDDHGKG